VVCLPSGGVKRSSWAMVAGFGRTGREKYTKSDNRLRQVLSGFLKKNNFLT
jgi:hypothetical protein